MSGYELQKTPSAAAPGPEQSVSPDPSWTALERWVWEKLQAGAIANIDEYEDKRIRLPPADPAKPEDWRDGRRRLPPSFIEDLLLREPYRGKLHHKGVRIKGAWFDHGIDLEWAEVTRPIWLDRCRFEQPVRLTGLRTPHIVSFRRSAFAAILQLELARIGGQLTALGAKLNGAVLSGAEVGGEVILSGAKVAGTLHMDGADIGHNLIMGSNSGVPEHRAEFDAVVLSSAKIGGQVNLLGAKVAGALDMASVDIGNSLFMASVSQQRAEFKKEVILSGAKIGGHVALIGAKITGKLTMESANIGSDLHMRSDRSVTDQRAEFNEVVLRGANVAGQVTLTGAEVTGTLNMASANIGRDLLMHSDCDVSGHRAGFKKEVFLIGAKIGGRIDLTGANVAGMLAMEAANIGQSLLMHSKPELRAEFKEVVLNGAKVGGLVSLIGAKVAGKLSMESADVCLSLFMHSDRGVRDHRAEFNEVVLNGTKIGGQVSLAGAKVIGKLTMQSADIGLSLFMHSDPGMSEHDAEFDGGADLTFAKIGERLDLRGALLSSLNLTGTKVGGELRLASHGRSLRWQHGGKLVLRNASVDAIQDAADEAVWPPHVELDGFTYRRFGGVGSGSEADVARRGSGWFVKWLAKVEPYTPQPSQQCAQVLREMGHPEMANDVLYAGRERERKQAWRSGNNSRGIGLTLLNWFIGYGYGLRYFRSLWWVAAFVLLGTLVLFVTGQIEEVGGSLLAATFYSFDLLLPIIELYKPHYEIVLDGLAKYYFAFHKLMGYVLASFLIAGLAGLTK